MFTYNTKIQKATRNSSTLRTTIPKSIVDALDLDIYDTLEWSIKIKDKDNLCVVVNKKS